MKMHREFHYNVLLTGLTLLTALTGSALANDQDRVAFTLTMMDKQFFTTPYERSATLGGAYMGEDASADSVIKNPAALGQLMAPDIKGYWVYSSYKGDGGANGPTTDEEISGRLSDEGGYAAMPILKLPLVIGVGADYLNTSFSDAPVTEPSQRGYRISGALAGKLSKTLSLGYGLTYFNDHHAWGTLFPYPGIMPPPKVNWVNDSSSWRHRLGVQHLIPDILTWGVQGDLGHGTGDNSWNGKNTGGDDALNEYSLRAGAKSASFYTLALLSDVEWRYMDLEFGNHEPMVGQTVPCQYTGDIYRIMVGLEQTLADWITLRYGYRYSMMHMKDFCHHGGRQDYSTLAGGLGLKFFRQRLNVAYNAEYSWLAQGDFMSTLTAGYRF